MVFGGIEHELLMLNESTVWSGSRNTTNVNPSAREYLGQMRQLFFEGKYAEGNAVCAKHLCGREDSFGTHLPLAKLRIDQSYPGEGHAAGSNGGWTCRPEWRASSFPPLACNFREKYSLRIRTK